TKAIRLLGLHVRLVATPFEQPLGRRSALDVWHRQLRWARLRRDTFKACFVPELFAGAAPALLLAAVTAGACDWPIALAVLPLAIAWYGAEALLAHCAGWQLTWRSILTWTMRDALLPLLWISAWLGSDFEWRGNAMTVADPRGAA